MPALQFVIFGYLLDAEREEPFESPFLRLIFLDSPDFAVLGDLGDLSLE